MACGVTVSSNHAYVADYSGTGLQVVDVSNPSMPTNAGTYSGLPYATELAVSGNYAFIADSNYGFQIVDMSDLENMSSVWESISAGNVLSVCAADDAHAYEAAEYGGLALCAN